MLANNGVEIVKVSSWYESSPVPVSDQPWYLNAVAEAITEHNATKTLAVLHDVENHFGRVRSAPNAPRVLDLDLLDFGGQICNSGHLILPHPRLHERKFVLIPLRDLNKNWVHPATGQPLDKLIEELPIDQLIRQV